MKNTLLDIRVGEAEFGSLRLKRPWTLKLAPTPYALLYAPIGTGAALSTDDRQTWELSKGSVVSLIGGQAHWLASSVDSLNAKTAAAIEFADLRQRFSADDTDERANLLVARVPLSANPLPEVLPTVIYVPGREQPLAGRLHQMLHLAVEINQAPTSARDPLLKRVAEMLAIELTEYALSSQTESWQTEFDDPRIQRAVGLMRVHPERPWSVAGLAGEARMSRSGFAARFRQVVGMTPLEYLRHCRVHAAIDLLNDTKLPLYTIAERVGYRSESAFSRIFSAATGKPPARYRRERD